MKTKLPSSRILMRLSHYGFDWLGVVRYDWDVQRSGIRLLKKARTWVLMLPHHAFVLWEGYL